MVLWKFLFSIFQVELFDVHSWEKLYSFEYPLALDNKTTTIWSENAINFQYSNQQLFIDNECLWFISFNIEFIFIICINTHAHTHTDIFILFFLSVEKKAVLSLSAIKNINEEFKIKSNLKFRLSYSQGNELLASYTPGFPNIVWIRSLKNNELRVISLNQQNIQGVFLS